MKNKKKAFTLTELLVVVIVIGVLSAVVLPKFSKVIETRKTTEAEELMSSIRTEQEKRCALDKTYLTQMSELTDVVKTASTKNYNITLKDKGINAASTGSYNYTLQMPSYADGRICCTGTDCEKLNKNYPNCEDLIAKADYQAAPESCAGVESTPDPEPTPKQCTGTAQTSQACASGCGTQTRTATCDTTTGTWQYGVWNPSSCPAKPQTETRECGTGYTGTQTRSAVCRNGAWVMGDWTGTCTKSCTGVSSRSCGCSSLFMTAKKGTQTRTCNTTTGTWSDWSACTGFTEWDRQQCSNGGDEEWQCVYSKSGDSWSWKQIVACKSGNCDIFEAQKCENPQNPNAEPGLWNNETCTCSCQSHAELDSEGECVLIGSDSGGEDCTWQDVGVFNCSPEGEAMARAACANYSQCSVNDYCPGKGITAEACI